MARARRACRTTGASQSITSSLGSARQVRRRRRRVAGRRRRGLGARRAHSLSASCGASAGGAGEHARQALERFGRLLQSRGDLIRVGPRGGFSRSASASSASRRAGSAVRCGIRSRTIGYHCARNAICSSGVAPSIADGIGRTRRAASPPCGFELQPRRRCASTARGRTAAQSAARRLGSAASSSGRRRLRGRRMSGVVSTICWLSRTAFQSNSMSGCCASISRSTSGSSASRPTRTPPGVRKTYRIRDRCGCPRGTSASDTWSRTRACRG